MNEKILSIVCRTGTVSNRSIPELLWDVLHTKPLYVWCEPRPDRDRVDDLSHLHALPFDTLERLLASQAPPAIEEVRVYHGAYWLHLLAVPRGIRWAEFSEGTGDPSEMDEDSAARCGLSTSGGARVNVRRFEGVLSRPVHDKGILLRRDRERFGLGSGDQPGRVGVREYLVGSERLTWRLEAV